MTPVPNPPSVADLRVELDQNGFRGWVWPWAQQKLRGFIRERLVRRYPPGVYSPTGRWDAEGISDLANDFLADRRRGDALRRAIHSAVSIQAVVKWLETACFNYMIEERGGTPEANVYGRLRDTLGSDPELRGLVSVGAGSAYGDAAWEGEHPRRATEEDFSAAERYLPDVLPRVEYTRGKRQSPVLATTTLREIARSIIRGTGLLFTAGQIMAVLKRRIDFGSLTAVENGTAQLAVISDPIPNPLEQAVAVEMATQLIGTLSARQKHVLWLLASDTERGAMDRIATEVGCSRTVAWEERKQIQHAALALRVSGAWEADQVLAAALKLLEAELSVLVQADDSTR